MVKNWKISLAMSAGLLTLVGATGATMVRAQFTTMHPETSSVAASATTAPTDDQQQVLSAALARLNEAAPKFDPATLKMVPDLRAIITRVVLHPETATPTEKAIAGNFISHTRDIFTDPAKAATAATVDAQVQALASAPVQFVSTTVQVPGGQAKGVVLLQNPADTNSAGSTVVEIPTGTKDYPVDRRAQIVADRLEAAHKDDPLWASKIEVDEYKNQVVVGLPGSKDGFVITADKSFATLRGVSPETLAYEIVDDIRNSVDPASTPSTRDLVADDELTPAEKLSRANGLREAGDTAYSQHDKDRAERLYLHAVRLAPQYAVPYIRLGDLYIEEKHFDKATDILQQAQTTATLADDQKAAVAKKLALAKSKS